jgi:hypothetical protein
LLFYKKYDIINELEYDWHYPGGGGSYEGTKVSKFLERKKGIT